MDVNQNALHFVSSSGFSQNKLELGVSFGMNSIVWPSSVTIGQSFQNSFSNSVTVYVSEYLGML